MVEITPLYGMQYNRHEIQSSFAFEPHLSTEKKTILKLCNRKEM